MMKKALFALLLAATLLTFALSALAAQELPELMLLTVYRQYGWGDRLEIGAVDVQGGLWTFSSETGALECPNGALEMEAHIRALPALKSCGQLDAKELDRLKGLALCVSPCEGGAVPVADDAGEQESWAFRSGGSGEREAVLLGMSGCDLLENMDPAAQELYAALRTRFPGVTAFADDPMISPKGFETCSVAEFCGIAEADLIGAKLEAYDNDCEAGMTQIEPECDIVSLLSLRVTGKENCECVTGGTVVYSITGADGERLAVLEFFNSLLVRGDGMYRVE